MTKQERALRLMQRPTGASVDQLAKVLKLENTKQARGLIDRLREKIADGDLERGTRLIKNVGNGTFKAHTRLNPRSS
jgi:hypothetical protein